MFKNPEISKRKIQSSMKIPNHMRSFCLSHLILIVSRWSSSTTCLFLCDGIFAQTANSFVFRCFDRHIAVHIRVLLHVAASLPRFLVSLAASTLLRTSGSYRFYSGNGGRRICRTVKWNNTACQTTIINRNDQWESHENNDAHHDNYSVGMFAWY